MRGSQVSRICHGNSCDQSETHCSRTNSSRRKPFLYIPDTSIPCMAALPSPGIYCTESSHHCRMTCIPMHCLNFLSKKETFPRGTYDRYIGYFSVAMIEHHNQGNLYMVYLDLLFQRNKSLSWQGSMAASSTHGSRRRKRRSPIFKCKQGEERTTGCGVRLQTLRAYPSPPASMSSKSS